MQAPNSLASVSVISSSAFVCHFLNPNVGFAATAIIIAPAGLQNLCMTLNFCVRNFTINQI